MAVRPRGSSWQADVRGADGKRMRADFATELEAKAWEAQALADRATGKDVSVPDRSDRSATLKDAYDLAMQKDWQGAVEVERRAKPMLLFFGPNLSIQAINDDKIDEYIEALREQGNSDSTINKKLSALRVVLTRAKKKGWLREVPEIQHFDEGAHRIRFLSYEEEARVLATGRHFGLMDWADQIVALIDTGCRKGELFKVTWADVNDRFLILWGRKNPSGTTNSGVPISQRLGVILKARKDRGDATPFGCVSYNALQDHWQRVRKHLGLDKDDQFVIHALRHTCASRLVQAGVDLRRVQVWMGHQNIATTLRYAHLAPADLLAGLDAVEAHRHKTAPDLKVVGGTGGM